MSAIIPGVKTLAKTGSTGLKGNVTLTGGTNVTLTQSGNDISIAASGSGSPAGSNTQIQYNNSGAFGASSNLVYDGTNFIMTGPVRSNQNGTAYSEFKHANAAGLNSFPRAFFYGYGAFDVIALANFALYVACGNATSTTQVPAFIGVSTNADVTQASSYQLSSFVNTTNAGIFTWNAENDQGTAGALDLYLGGAKTNGTTSPVVIKTTGNVGVGVGSSASTTLDVNGTFRINTATPASAAATGVAGQIAWDSSFIYICTATNTWKRVAIATW
jgi:hypothetical protein